MVLTGTEVKSLRDGHASLEDAYAKIEDDEVWLIGSDIPEYAMGNRMNHKPKRRGSCCCTAARSQVRRQGGAEAASRWCRCGCISRKGRAKVELAVAARQEDVRQTRGGQEGGRPARHPAGDAGSAPLDPDDPARHSGVPRPGAPKGAIGHGGPPCISPRWSKVPITSAAATVWRRSAPSWSAPAIRWNSLRSRAAGGAGCGCTAVLHGADVVLQRRLLPRLGTGPAAPVGPPADLRLRRRRFPPRFLRRPGLHQRRRLRRFAATVRAADAVIAGNAFPRRTRRPLGRTCPRVTSSPPASIPPSLSTAEPRTDDGVQLVWVGSSSTLRGLEAVRPMLEELGRRVPGVRLKIICDRFLHFDAVAGRRLSVDGGRRGGGDRRRRTWASAGSPTTTGAAASAA